MEFKKYKLGEITEITAGGDAPNNYTKEPNSVNSIPIFSNGIENEGLYGYTNFSKIDRNSFTISARGTIGVSFKRNKPYYPIVRYLLFLKMIILMWIIYIMLQNYLNSKKMAVCNNN